MKGKPKEMREKERNKRDGGGRGQKQKESAGGRVRRGVEGAKLKSDSKWGYPVKSKWGFCTCK